MDKKKIFDVSLRAYRMSLFDQFVTCSLKAVLLLTKYSLEEFLFGHVSVVYRKREYEYNRDGVSEHLDLVGVQ